MGWIKGDLGAIGGRSLSKSRGHRYGGHPTTPGTCPALKQAPQHHPHQEQTANRHVFAKEFAVA